MKIKNINLHQIIIGFVVTLAIMYVIKGGGEKYEGQTGPSGKKTEKITAEDLKAVMKFIG